MLLVNEIKEVSESLENCESFCEKNIRNEQRNPIAFMMTQKQCPKDKR